MSNINILHLRSATFYGGPERQLHYHCLKAANSDFNITCGSFSEGNKTPEFLDIIAQDNINTHTFDVKSAYDFSAIKQVRDFLIEKNIDIICTHDYRSHVIGWLSSRKTKVKWIAFSRGWTKDDLKIRLYCWFDKFIIRFADHIIAVSHAQKKRLINVLISPSKITTAHNAINPSAFESITKINLRDLYHLSKDSIIGISGGRFSYEKGQRYLVEAAKLVVQKNDKFKFILYGDGPDFQKIQDQIKDLSLQNYIFCPGFEKNMIGCLKGADFLVNPSLSEGLPNIVLETMAMKIPCVATDVGGVGEIIEDELNGLLVPAKSPNKLAEAILKIAYNEHQSFKEKAYQTIIDKFSFDIQYETITKVYSQVVKN